MLSKESYQENDLLAEKRARHFRHVVIYLHVSFALLSDPRAILEISGSAWKVKRVLDRD